MAPLVMAAGALAGGMVGKAIMGKPAEPAQPLQVDLKPAMSMIQIASNTLFNASKLSAGSYASAMDTAQTQVKEAYASVNAQLKPMSDAGNASYNEYLRMIGQDPMQATGGMSTRVGSIGFSGDTSGLQALFDKATMERDPAKRLELKTQVSEAIRAQGIADNRAAEMAALGTPTMSSLHSPLQKIVLITDPKKKDVGQIKQKDDVEATHQMGTMINQQNAMTNESYGLARQAINKKWDTQVADATEAKNNLLNDFEREYTEKYDAAYTADQVQQKIKDTVGYNVALKSGTQALSRMGAQAGGLMSGNTGLALQRYGQELATGTYQNTLSNLLGSAQVGQAATDAMNQNTLSLGGVLAQMSQQAGEFAANEYQTRGASQATMWENAANMNIENQKNNISLILQKQLNDGKVEAAKIAGMVEGALKGRAGAAANAGAIGTAAGIYAGTGGFGGGGTQAAYLGQGSAAAGGAVMRGGAV